jgi:predicted nucleic acid-binding protein
MDLREPLYADTSALVKLVVNEAESEALVRFVSESGFQLTSSEICEVELMRAVNRIDSDLESDAEALLEEMVLLPLTAGIRTRAAHLRPKHVKSLDAVHLASAIEIQANLTSFLSYDKALNDAALSAGLEPVSPT